MDWQRSCAVVIPCFEEERAIGAVVRQCRRVLPLVIVVDDGSRDETRAQAESAGAFGLAHSENRGKGAALATGLKHALKQECSWAIVLDGDGQHDPSEIQRFLEAAETTKADFIVGDRMANNEAMPWLRRF